MSWLDGFWSRKKWYDDPETIKGHFEEVSAEDDAKDFLERESSSREGLDFRSNLDDTPLDDDPPIRNSPPSAHNPQDN